MRYNLNVDSEGRYKELYREGEKSEKSKVGNLEMACEGERTLVGAAKLNQISRMVSFMLLESGGGGMSGRSFFRSSDSTPSSYKETKGDY